MSGQYSQTSFLILSILISFSLFRSSKACGITIYWNGDGGAEASLRNACATGKYQYVALASLTTFGSGQVPVLNLSTYCYAASGSCWILMPEIEACQNQGVKVLLSLGGRDGSYNISSPENAREVAKYLWDHYLSIPDSSIIGRIRPLGDVPLDGIDFDIENPGSTLYWDVLANALSEYSTPERKIYLSAAPKCTQLASPIYDIGIRTQLFDYVSVQFYNNPICDYSGGILTLFTAWELWNLYIPEDGKLFLGLPVAPTAASSGYIPPDVLVNQILPVIRTSLKYGGVTLWNYFYDADTGYSDAIYPAVCDDTLNRKELLISQVV